MSYAGAEPEPESAATTQARHRSTSGRLFRRYFVLILSLVTTALLASGGATVYFTYQETKSFVASLQREKALAAASRIEDYIGNIERQLGTRGLKRSLEQQTAIGEILRIISSSPSDFQPVLEVVAQRGAQLCDAAVGGVILSENGLLHATTIRSASGEPVPPISPVPLKRTSVTGRAVLDRETVHHADRRSRP
jgi:hypothetical protein